MLPLSNNEGIELLISLAANAFTNTFPQIIPVKGALSKIEDALNNSFLLSPRSNQLIQDHNDHSDKLLTIQRHILEFISDILKVDIAHVAIEASFGEYGFTSLSLQILSDRIKQIFSLEVPPSAFFTFNTPISSA